ncbi:MAG: hypothetical protein LBJ57_03110 [Prevotellaceae bacterium]|jgi:hypothetical protein|nr:hypothetical protein [Prevotellaceae bacterium]
MNDKSSISEKILDRLEEFLSKKGDTPASLVKELGVSRGYFSTARRVGTELGSDKIVRILQLYPDLSPDWLLLGNGLMIRNASLSNLNELLERDKKLREAQQNLGRIQDYLTDLQANFADLRAKKAEPKKPRSEKTRAKP